MRRWNKRDGRGLRSKFAAIIAAVAMLVTSVAAGTALAADGDAVDDGGTQAGKTVQQQSNREDTSAAGNNQTATDESVQYEAVATVADGKDVTVHVDAPAGALPDGVTLEASSIGEQDVVASTLDGADVDYDGFVALDVRFVDANGAEVEPSAAVDVSFDVPQAALGSDVNASSVSVQHFVEDEQGDVEKVETVADSGDVADGTVTVDGAQTMNTDADAKSLDGTVRAEFTVDSFSTFTITWGAIVSSINIDVTCINSVGNDPLPNGVAPEDISVFSDQDVSFTGDNSDLYIEGYTFDKAEYSHNGSTWAPLTFIRANYHPFGGKSFYWDYTYDGHSGERQAPQIRLYYTKNQQGGGQGGTTVTNATVTTGKTAVLRDDGNYDLTLSVSGDRGSSESKQKVDVLFILDKSGSMTPDRMSQLKDAVNTLVSTVGDNDGIDARYAAVAFAGDGHGNHGSTYTTDTLGDAWRDDNGIKTFVQGISAVGGTNYQRAIHEGKTLLNSADDDALTFVVFVSDGIPTYRGNDDDSGDGSGDDYGLNIGAAVDEIQDMSCDYFYAIGMGSDFGQDSWPPYGDKQGTKNLKSLANSVNAASKGDGNVYSASDTEGMQDAFNRIAGDITHFAAKDVRIKDPLSQYAEIVSREDGQVMFTVKLEKQNEDGDYEQVDHAYVTSGSSVEFTTKASNGEGVMVDTTFTITPSFNNDRTITATLDGANGASYELAPGYRYSISTVITSSQEAKSANKLSEDANRTPDIGTGTHADRSEKGFWSNDNDNAKVTYTANGQSGSENFPKPVIRVQEPTSVELPAGSLKVVKKVEGRGWLSNESFAFTLTAGTNTAGTDTSTPMPEGALGMTTTSTIQVDATDNAEGSDSRTFADYFGAITYKKPGVYYYKLEEVVPESSDERHGLTYSKAEYEITVTVPEDMSHPEVVVRQLLDDAGEPASGAVAGAEAVFVNSLAPYTYTVDEHLKLHKQLDGLGLESGMFDFTLSAVAVDDKDELSPTQTVDGMSLPERVNVSNGDEDGDGSGDDDASVFDFGTITFSKPGTYYVRVVENDDAKPESGYYVFDKHALYVRYEVTVNQNGELDVTRSVATYVPTDDAPDPVDENLTWASEQDVAIPEEMLTWHNTYVAPVSSLPLTGGDSTARSLLLAGGGVLLVAGVAWLLARRRRV